MDPAVAIEPKKRGRPRKVVSEDAPAVEVKKSVRKASTKTAAKKEDAPKKVAKAARAATKTATKTAIKATEPASTPKSASTQDEAKIASPTTSSPSKILHEVYKTGTMKPPASEPPVEEVVLPTGGAANVVMEQPIATEVPAATSPSTQIPSPPSSAPPPAAAASSASPLPLSTHTHTHKPSPSTPSSTLRPTPAKFPNALPKRATTIPLPANPLNPSQPAAPRPKPPTPEALEKAAIERDINEGRMPAKYKGAARRVTSIMVGIPVIIVVGWELYKRWDAEIKTKYGGEERKPVDA